MAKNDNFMSDFAKMVWGKRLEGLPVPELKLKDEITQQELANILQKYAFVQIFNPEALGDNSDIRFIRSRSGWLILNYGNAMSTSPGEMLYYHGTYTTDEEGSLQRICSGLGTNTMQIINTAADMVRIAKEEKWPSIHIVGGHPLATWGIWKSAMDLDMAITGYTPDEEDKAKYQRILQYCPKTLVIQPEPPTAAP